MSNVYLEEQNVPKTGEMLNRELRTIISQFKAMHRSLVAVLKSLAPAILLLCCSFA